MARALKRAPVPPQLVLPLRRYLGIWWVDRRLVVVEDEKKSESRDETTPRARRRRHGPCACRCAVGAHVRNHRGRGKCTTAGCACEAYVEAAASSAVVPSAPPTPDAPPPSDPRQLRIPGAEMRELGKELREVGYCGAPVAGKVCVLVAGHKEPCQRQGWEDEPVEARRDPVASSAVVPARACPDGVHALAGEPELRSPRGMRCAECGGVILSTWGSCGRCHALTCSARCGAMHSRMHDAARTCAASVDVGLGASWPCQLLEGHEGEHRPVACGWPVVKVPPEHTGRKPYLSRCEQPHGHAGSHDGKQREGWAWKLAHDGFPYPPEVAREKDAAYAREHACGATGGGAPCALLVGHNGDHESARAAEWKAERCDLCGCDTLHHCDTGSGACFWVNGALTRCSACQELLDFAKEYVRCREGSPVAVPALAVALWEDASLPCVLAEGRAALAERGTARAKSGTHETTIGSVPRLAAVARQAITDVAAEEACAELALKALGREPTEDEIRTARESAQRGLTIAEIAEELRPVCGAPGPRGLRCKLAPDHAGDHCVPADGGEGPLEECDVCHAAPLIDCEDPKACEAARRGHILPMTVDVAGLVTMLRGQGKSRAEILDYFAPSDRAGVGAEIDRQRALVTATIPRCGKPRNDGAGRQGPCALLRGHAGARCVARTELDRLRDDPALRGFTATQATEIRAAWDADTTEGETACAGAQPRSSDGVSPAQPRSPEQAIAATVLRPAEIGRVPVAQPTRAEGCDSQKQASAHVPSNAGSGAGKTCDRCGTGNACAETRGEAADRDARAGSALAEAEETTLRAAHVGALQVLAEVAGAPSVGAAWEEAFRRGEAQIASALAKEGTSPSTEVQALSRLIGAIVEADSGSGGVEAGRGMRLGARLRPRAQRGHRSSSVRATHETGFTEHEHSAQKQEESGSVRNDRVSNGDSGATAPLIGVFGTNKNPCDQHVTKPEKPTAAAGEGETSRATPNWIGVDPEQAATRRTAENVTALVAPRANAWRAACATAREAARDLASVLERLRELRVGWAMAPADLVAALCALRSTPEALFRVVEDWRELAGRKAADDARTYEIAVHIGAAFLVAANAGERNAEETIDACVRRALETLILRAAASRVGERLVAAQIWVAFDAQDPESGSSGFVNGRDHAEMICAMAEIVGEPTNAIGGLSGEGLVALAEQLQVMLERFAGLSEEAAEDLSRGGLVALAEERRVALERFAGRREGGRR